MISWLSHVESKHLVKPSCKFLFLLSHTPNRLHGPRPMLHEATSSRPVQGWRRPSVPVDQSWQPTAAWRSDGMVYISIYIYTYVYPYTYCIYLWDVLWDLFYGMYVGYMGNERNLAKYVGMYRIWGYQQLWIQPSNMVSWCATIKYGC